jgi:hypothetical protein
LQPVAQGLVIESDAAIGRDGARLYLVPVINQFISGHFLNTSFKALSSSQIHLMVVGITTSAKGKVKEGQN